MRNTECLMVLIASFSKHPAECQLHIRVLDAIWKLIDLMDFRYPCDSSADTCYAKVFSA